MRCIAISSGRHGHGQRLECACSAIDVDRCSEIHRRSTGSPPIHCRPQESHNVCMWIDLHTSRTITRHVAVLSVGFNCSRRPYSRAVWVSSVINCICDFVRLSVCLSVSLYVRALNKNGFSYHGSRSVCTDPYMIKRSEVKVTRLSHALPACR